MTVPVRAKVTKALLEAEELLHELPPLSPDHETVRLAIVRLQRAQGDLSNARRFSSSCLTRSRDTVDQAWSVIRTVREQRSRPRQSREHGASNGTVVAATVGTLLGTTPNSAGSATPSTIGVDGGVPVFLDLDTVLLATHMGKYGPELALQGGLDEPLERLVEAAGAVIIVVNPRGPDTPNVQDTQNRLRAVSEGLGARINRLIIAICPHGEQDSCDCSKPGSGLIEHALKEHSFSAEGGWYVCGDQQGVVSGRAAGLKTVRIGPAGEDRLSAIHRADYEARDLLDASNHIMYEVMAL